MISTERAIQLSYPAVRDTAANARHAVSDLGLEHGATAEQLERVRVGVTEAVTNAIVHAYPDTDGLVHVTASAFDGQLWVIVADDGRGFQTASVTPGLGWGMPLIAHAADDFVVAERSSGGTEVRMRFPLGRDSRG